MYIVFSRYYYAKQMEKRFNWNGRKNNHDIYF